MYLSNKKSIQLWELILICSPALFLVGVNKYISPIFVVVFFSCFMCLFKIVLTKRVSAISLNIVFYFFSITILTLVLQAALYDLKYGIENELIRYILPFIYLFLVLNVLYDKKYNDILKLAVNFLNFNIFVCILEAIYRIFVSLGKGVFSFYSFKYESLLYPDSNFIAINIVVLLIFIDRLSYLGVVIPKSKEFIYKLILIILLIFSFSRTLYFAYIVYMCICMVKNFRGNIFNILFIPSIIMALILGLNGLVDEIQDDGSFQTKQHIFDSSLQLLISDSEIFFLGIGSGNAIDVIERESHNFIGISLEMGMVWSLSYLFFLSYLMYKGGVNVIFLLLPILISMFTSLFPVAYMSFTYTAIAILIFLQKTYEI